ncbi:hypothetical protein [Rhizobium sp. FKL33]|jgi:hypothetical protein|uniref:hypothetical protein n=1 Tax=Rhizobium sp. FKL33 TaxID=2562307 RepID=UPI0010C08EC8|nr:hypothetical protein [Rhizobium sp. FKL33]
MQKQVVELAGEPVGIAIRDGESLRFLAVKFHAMGVDGQVFPSMAAIKNAISQLGALHRRSAA